MKSLQLSEKELKILRLLQSGGKCTVSHVASRLSIGTDFIAVLRMIHGLHRKELVEQILTGSESLYTLSEEGMYLLGRLNEKSKVIIKE